MNNQAWGFSAAALREFFGAGRVLIFGQLLVPDDHGFHPARRWTSFLPVTPASTASPGCGAIRVILDAGDVTAYANGSSGGAGRHAFLRRPWRGRPAPWNSIVGGRDGGREDIASLAKASWFSRIVQVAGELGRPPGSSLDRPARHAEITIQRRRRAGRAQRRCAMSVMA